MLTKRLFLIQMLFCFFLVFLYPSYAGQLNIAMEKVQKTGINENISSNEDSQDIIVAPPPGPLSHFDLPSISETTGDDEPHFIKIAVSLGFEQNDRLEKELKSRNEQIQHIIHVILKSRFYEDINSVEGMIDLSEEIKAHINAVLTSAKIEEVYFKEFIVN